MRTGHIQQDHRLERGRSPYGNDIRLNSETRLREGYGEYSGEPWEPEERHRQGLGEQEAWEKVLRLECPEPGCVQDEARG